MDKIFTEKIGNFLQKENPTDQEIRDGALLLLQCNPNRERAIYNSAQKRPQAMLAWIRADLKKYYDIRKRGLTRDQVPVYNAAAVKAVRESLAKRPADAPEEKTPQVPVLGVRGKRADHDQLPAAIQKLYDDNTERWKKIRQLHNQLLVMVSKPGYQPCDGNELCHTLREADTLLRQNYKKYDSFVVVPGQSKESQDDVEVTIDNMKVIQNARTAISRGLQREQQTEESLQKLQEAYDTLTALHQNIKPETVAKLKAAGVNVGTDA